ncbi:hypothetical protein ACQY0O_000631 [Thecaphora frezii]
MPSQSARQRNKRALATTGSASKLPTRSTSGSSSPTRLRSLLSVLLLTSVLLVGLQLVRFYYRGASSLSPLSAWTKAKYASGSDIASSASNVDMGASAFHPAAPEGAQPGAPALVPGLEVVDHDVYVAQEEGELEVQFDEDGNMDMATAQRMLDLLYRPARQGVKTAAKVAAAMVEDEIVEEAADDAEVQDEAMP